MATMLYCRHAECGVGYWSVAGKVPELCPACSRVGKWSTMPAAKEIPPGVDPIGPYEVTTNDRRFLRGIKIEPDR